MKKQQFDPSINLLDVRPKRLADWETADDGRVVILVPKFTNRFLVKALLPYLKSKHFRLQLDAYGTAFWNACTGGATVGSIIETMKRAFPDQAETMSERTISFTRNLFREKFIGYDIQADSL
ncbi:MAG: PqqD family protein [Acidobacteriota bacterium]